jgi:site-specific DNA-methyltransferase (adenine-specific)
MQIIELKTDELIPYVNNPRQNDEAVDYVAASISEFGFKVPIIIDSSNVIVAGHTRLRAAKKLGLETVPCIMADDLSEQQIKAFRVADNKVGEMATWDLDKLMIELEALDDIDMSDYGFEELEKQADALLEESDEEELEDVDRLETHYGVPYQGNKSRIADKIINLLPEGKRLVDLFGGGRCNHSLCNAHGQMELLSV